MNKRDSKPNKNKDSIAENVRLLLQSETVFEDEAYGMATEAISSEDLADMDKDTIKQIILGVDLENQEYEEQLLEEMSELQRINLKADAEQLKEETKDSLDLSYYRLGNHGLQILIPTLEREHLLSLNHLDVSYNSLNDAGVEPLI